MKKVLGFLIFLIMLSFYGCTDKQTQTEETGLSGKITLSGAWALYPMAVKWAEEFQKLHPKVIIDISAGGAGKGMADALSQAVDLGMVSRDINPAEIEKGAWWVSMVKDAVVPTVNQDNPVLDTLLSAGITREQFRDIWITGKITDWNIFAEANTDLPISVYTRSDACGAAKTWAKYLGSQQEDLLGVGVYGDPGLAEAVISNRTGIGFNNINYVYDSKSKEQVKGIRVLPIDLNGNGWIDEEEGFYSNRDEITEAIAKGRYPSPPARDLHFVSQGPPKRKQVTEFICWALSHGQAYVSEAGYIKLPEERLKEQIDLLKMPNQ
ncbi:MAG TPA: substrate-binding domain-containing protein [Desulfobacteraceae bacterium]|nr:substrate-binding domain-containing protein [Desulfobacteraceae bacterium]HPJ66637.1 substrate-binding domain-containing protein [Desulfobacteraceae bacterium]